MQITKHVHALKIPFQVPITPEKKIDRFVYVHLIYGERVWLIDTGVASSEAVIRQYLLKTGKDMRDIAGIVLTHSHPDHIGSAKRIRQESDCFIAAHVAEKSWIEDVELQARERPVPGFSALVGGSVKLDRILSDGDVLDLENDLRLEVIHTPGHSKGSISLLLRDEGVLFSGDAVPVNGDMPIYEDADTSAASLKKLKAIGGIRYMLSSWDSPREGSAAYHTLESGSSYLDRIHKAVLKAAGSEQNGDAMQFCRRVLDELGLPSAMANPLVARSFQANLAADPVRRQQESASNQNFAIRKAVDNDCDSIVHLFNYYVENSFAAYPEQPFGWELFDFLKTIIHGDAFFVVENKEKNVIGFGFLKKYHPYPAFNRTAEAGYFILPEYTRHGFGEQLLKRLEMEARTLGVDNLLANISSLNPSSISFHEKQGFRQCGRFEKILSKFGKDLDIIWMQKKL